MAVNFNVDACTARTNKKIFGICDDVPIPSETQTPAYLDSIDDTDKWIAWVENDKEKEIIFTAIDHCISITRPNGEMESRCDNMLKYDSTLIFVELKDRDSKGWLGDARDQLKITINIYTADVGLDGYTRHYGYVCNKQRPHFNAANKSLAEEFENETGFVLIVDPVIKIE